MMSSTVCIGSSVRVVDGAVAPRCLVTLPGDRAHSNNHFSHSGIASIGLCVDTYRFCVCVNTYAYDSSKHIGMC